ncbi:MAG TPA: four helix bundle protein [Steroidobacteraceae bacterium]|nr:four helix bundle protein [Steroidobacteraceae bacterium]
MRDHCQLKVFQLADDLAKQVYRGSKDFPRDELFGLTAQVRRAAVSIAANIVEGCARSSHSDYIRFLEIAYGSARELQYELGLCNELGYLEPAVAANLSRQCTETAKALNGLIRALRNPAKVAAERSDRSRS